MKNLMITYVLIMASIIAFSQKGSNMENAVTIENINSKKDIKVDGKSIIKKSKNATLAKVAIHFKVITNGKSYIDKKAFSTDNATESVTWAVLKGVSEETMQEITDSFYVYLNEQLNKKLNLPTLSWNQVEQAKAFQKINDKQIDKYYDSKKDGAFVIKTANNGPHTRPIVGNPGTWGAYTKLSKELKTNPILIDIIIDFAQFDIELYKHRGYKNTTTSTSANITPEITIEYFYSQGSYNAIMSGISVIGKKGGSAGTIYITKDIAYPMNFSTDIKSYDGKVPEGFKKRNFTFNNTMTTGTYVIEADEEKYKEAVLNALKTYVDVLIEKMLEIRS
jgi:hypothetical protein